ncbi:MAG: hypothetical protein Q8922_14400 [Bacteroidota bacterium]|nr:hypothetical protein [Bacteroidota bacterium]MDP4234350.1 hypothetical protein [Bacteroidota bacterium]MDP4243284.1 hypothetical protein [Bacteroidota bacterium]MDP4289109.1 hypothetical protein [Bacteroidota bacterium]
MSTRIGSICLAIVLAASSANAQVTVDITKLNSSAYGIVLLWGNNSMQTDNMPYSEQIKRFGIGIKYGDSLKLKGPVHFTFDVGYEVLADLRIPDTNIASSYTLGEFMAEVMLLYSPVRREDFDLSIYIGGKLGFPAMKDAQGLYSGEMFVNDTTARQITVHPVPITMSYSMPLTYEAFFGASFGLPIISEVYHPEVFIGGTYLCLPFSNVSYTPQDGRHAADIVDRLPNQFTSRSSKLGLEFGVSFSFPK